MGDDGGDVQTGAEHGVHLLPGGEHLAAVDTLHLEALPDEGVPVDAGAAGLDAEQGDASAVHGVLDDVLQAGGSAAHLQADVVALGHLEVLHGLLDGIAVLDVDGAVGAQLLGEVEAEVGDIGDGDALGAGLLADGGGHGADEARAGDEHVLTHQIPGEGGVGGVAQRVQDGGDLHGHIRVDGHHVALRDGEVLGEASGAVHAHALGVRAEVELAAAAIAAMAADDVALAGDDLSGLVGGHGRAHFLNDAAVLVAHVHADGDGLLGPRVPVPDVHVGAADGGLVNLDENIVGSDFGHGYVQQLEPLVSLCFDESLHMGVILHFSLADARGKVE